MNTWTLILFLGCHLVRFSAAALTNRTIDDQFGDSVSGLLPSYSPASAWSQGANCTGCFIKADPTRAFDGSWHDSTHTPGDPEPRVVQIIFNGTAVYAYCIIANTVQYTTTLTNLTISMDSEVVGTYVHMPNSSTAYEYGVPVYVNTTLSNTQHTLTLEATGDTNSSLILFDYVTYTFNSDPSPSSSTPIPSTTASDPPQTKRSNLGAIVGGVVGGIAAVIITLLAFLLLRRRSQNTARVAIDVDDDKPAAPGTLAGTNMQTTQYNPYGEGRVAGDSTIAFMTSTHDSAHAPPTALPSSGLGSSTSHLTLPPGGVVVRSHPVPGSKAAQRQEELARQVQVREQELADLQKRRVSIRRPPSSAPSSSVSPLTSVNGAETDVNMASEVERLKQEVQRLQEQQRKMLWELNDAPPPEYS